MGKLSKADYEKSKVRKGQRRILGTDKNPEGQAMATALFIAEKGRPPIDKYEARDFHKQITSGHSETITNYYECEFGYSNPVKTVQTLTAELRKAELPTQTRTEVGTGVNIEDFLYSLENTAHITFYIGKASKFREFSTEITKQMDQIAPNYVYQIILNDSINS